MIWILDLNYEHNIMNLDQEHRYSMKIRLVFIAESGNKS